MFTMKNALYKFQSLLTCPFIDFNRFPIQFTNFYRLLSNVIDYRFYRLHMPGRNGRSFEPS